MCRGGLSNRTLPVAAYVISDVSVRDAAAIQTYRVRAAASIARYGGRYLARGGAVTSLEGSWRPEAIILVEFPDAEQARAWYHSPEYAAALDIRDQALGRDLILVEGIDGSK